MYQKYFTMLENTYGIKVSIMDKINFKGLSMLMTDENKESFFSELNEPSFFYFSKWHYGWSVSLFCQITEWRYNIMQ